MNCFFSVALAFFCFYNNFSGASTTLYRCRALSPMSYFTIVFAGVFGWLLWSETPDMRTFIGVALVLFSGLLTVLTGRKQEAAETRSHTS